MKEFFNKHGLSSSSQSESLEEFIDSLTEAQAKEYFDALFEITKYPLCTCQRESVAYVCRGQTCNSRDQEAYCDKCAHKHEHPHEPFDEGIHQLIGDLWNEVQKEKQALSRASNEGPERLQN